MDEVAFLEPVSDRSAVFAHLSCCTSADAVLLMLMYFRNPAGVPFAALASYVQVRARTFKRVVRKGGPDSVPGRLAAP